MGSTDDLWIFGYGSLIWRPDFPFEEHRDGHIRGLARRFYQGSTDHRGTPQAPGRVVTLLPEDHALCRGRAFRVASQNAATVTAELDHRERAGYRRYRTPFFAAESGPIQVTVYVAAPENVNYLGPAPLADMARQVVEASGSSGTNREYVLELAAALREAHLQDPHVFELEQAVLKLMS